jgi:general secretion pathway protein I
MSPRHQFALQSAAVRPARRQIRRSGFTLLELMVALAILAIALSAVMRAVGAATNNVNELRLRTLAGWVADNRLAEHRARRDWLPVGHAEGQVEQGGVIFRWAEDIQPTPNAQFRRIEVSVWSVPEAGDAKPPRVLTTLNGFLTAS